MIRAKGVILLNEKCEIVGLEKTIIKRCWDMGIAPPACYSQEGGKWWRTKTVAEEYRQQRNTCYQLGLLACIRNILAWFLGLTIASIVLSILF